MRKDNRILHLLYEQMIKNISLEKELEIAKRKIALLKDENEMLYQLLKEKSYRLEVICNNSDFYLVINDDAWFKINKELADNLSDFLKNETKTN